MKKTVMDDILGAYRALEELRDRVWFLASALERRIGKRSASSFTLSVGLGDDGQQFHRLESSARARRFIDSLAARQIGLINSAVMHGGFLGGGNFFDYRPIDQRTTRMMLECLHWRRAIHRDLSAPHRSPFQVAVAFGRSHPGVVAVALSTSRPGGVGEIGGSSDLRDSQFTVGGAA